MNPRLLAGRVLRRARPLAGRALRRLGLRGRRPMLTPEPPGAAGFEEAGAEEVGVAEPFPGSATYWERRYAAGGTSGRGSYGELAQFKALVLNDFVASKGIRTVLEYGCGDGNQLTEARYPSYVGLDVSETSVALCRRRFADDATKSFALIGDHDRKPADLTLSLDVLYHLIEDDVFEQYMARLFDTATAYVAIYASNTDDGSEWGPLAAHVRHRRFTDWVGTSRPEWTLVDRVLAPFPYDAQADSDTFADFYFYVRR